VKGVIGGRPVEVALDTQASASMVSAEVVAGFGITGAAEWIEFGVGQVKSQGYAVLNVDIDGVKRPLRAQVVAGLTADVIVGMTDCGRWGMRWEPDPNGSPGRLFLGDQGFWWRDGWFDPLFVPVATEAPIENGNQETQDAAPDKKGEAQETVKRPTQIISNTENAVDPPSLPSGNGTPARVLSLAANGSAPKGKEEEGVWHNFTIDDRPPDEELADLLKLEAPPANASGSEREAVLKTLMEKARAVPNAGGLIHEIEKLVQECADIFENTLQRPGSATVEHRIDTGSAAPFVDPPRKYSAEKMQFLLAVQQDWSARGIIEPSESEWAANPHCVPDESKPGGYRPCGDYRGLNQRTVADSYPADSMDSVYDCVRRSDLTTKMDGVEGYFAIPIAKGDRPKTAIRLPVTPNTFGLFQLCVALFGLKNAGAAFDRWMNSIVAKFNRPTVVSLRDDIFLTTVRRTGETDEELLQRHLGEVREFWNLLRKEGARLKPSKLRLAVPASEPLEVLGYVVQNHKLMKRQSDIEAILKFPVPQTKVQLQRFTGSVEWVRRFIPSLARVEGPLVDAGKMPEEIRVANEQRKAQGRPALRDWRLKLSEEALASFEATKRAIAEQIELSVFSDDDKAWETIIALDAGGGALAGVLLQRRREGPPQYQLIACCSRRMTRAELNYVPMEQELLAIYFCLKQWVEFVERRCVVIWSDHQPLQYMAKQVTAHSRGRITRWFLFMQDFLLKVEHVPGAQNEFPDALSRMFEESSTRELSGEDRADPSEIGRAAFSRVLTGRVGTTEEKDILGQMESKLLDIIKEQQSCPEVIAIRHWLAKGELPEAWAKDHGAKAERLKATIARYASKFVEWDEVLYIRGDSGRTRLVVPVRLRRILVQQAHDAPTGGHRGADKTTDRLRACYWWPDMKEDIASYVRSCPDCERAKRPWPHVGDLQPLDVTKVFEYMHLDLIGPLPKTYSGNAYILNAVDRATKRTVLVALPNKESRTVARAIVKIICWHGSAPATIQTDQGSEFINQVVRDVAHLLGMNHVTGATYRPQTNGQAERMNLQIEQMLAIFGDPEQRTWDMNLDFVMYALNATKSDVTGETPHFLAWGRRALEPIDLLFGVDPDPTMSQHHWLDRLKKARELAAQANEEANSRMKERVDQEREPHSIKEGDTVWVQEKRVPSGLSAKLRPKAADVEYEVKELTGGGDKHAKVVAVGNPRDERAVHVERLKPVVQEPEGIFGEEKSTKAKKGNDEFEVERVLDHRKDKSGTSYLIRWRGFGPQDDSWVAEKDLQADRCLAEYKRHLENSKVKLSEPKVLTYAEVAAKGKAVGSKTVKKATTSVLPAVRRNPPRFKSRR
jgi:hypothetical protein